jgi:hypothetical protein
MANSRESLLQEFVDWARDHITGDEKGEAQIFLDRLFRAFGQEGSLDVGRGGWRVSGEAAEDGSHQTCLQGMSCSFYHRR